MKQRCLANGRRVLTDLAELSVVDQLFAMLDGHEISGWGGSWRTEVVGIHETDDATWVQIGPSQHPRWDNPARAVMMKLGEDARIERALDALREWSELPESLRPDRIEVTAAD